MRNKYQTKDRKSNRKFEVVGGQDLLMRVPLPMVEVWEELQAQVEQLTGQAGLQIIGTILEEEVARRVGPPHRPGPASSCVRWGRQPGYVVFGGQKVSIPRPRVRTREGEEVTLDSYARLQHDGRRQRAVREGIVAGLTTRNYHRAVESVVVRNNSVRPDSYRQVTPQVCDPVVDAETRFSVQPATPSIAGCPEVRGNRAAFPEGQKLRRTFGI